jgi:epoxyqueuosine reductase
MQPPSTNPAISIKREALRAWAIESGFSDTGLVALPHEEDERDSQRFEEWVQAGHAGSMHYLERRSETGKLVRARVAVPFAWARSAIVCFARYDNEQPRSVAPAAEGAAWIARYAWSSRRDANGQRRPSDYHKVLLKRLKALELRMHAEFGDFESRAYVDTGPVVERSLATAAGLGWTAKNTCLIHPQLGSFGFLAVLLTSLPAEEEKRDIKVIDRCGSCRRCIDACPTDALFAPYRMDATRCISYLTIEHKEPIAEALMADMGRQVFGCDICQDVCPWNGKSLRSVPITVDPEMEPRTELVNPALEALAEMDEAAFEAAFNGSPVRRAGYNGLRRNVAIAMGNSGLTRFISRLEAWAQEADEGLRGAALWAFGRLKGAKTREGIS